MYQIINANMLRRLADGAGIPRDPENGDYGRFLEWEAAGNTPLPAEEDDWRTPAWSDFKARREVYLNRLAGIATFEADPLVKQAAADFRTGLLELPAHASVQPDVTATEQALKDAVMLRYRALVEAAILAAPGSKAIFDKVAK